MIDKYKNFKYKNTVILLIGILFALYIARFEPFNDFLLRLGGWGYLGAFIAGILFVWIFSVPTAIVILLTLSEFISPIEIGIIAGAGAVVGDLLIFKFVRNRLSEELTDIYDNFGGSYVKRIFHSKYFNWTLPIIGAIIIASPFPDELGVSLLGISKMKTLNFIILSFVLNSLGIYFFLILGEIF